LKIFKIVISTALVFSALIANAQTKAVTEKGDEVILFDNGTWKSANVKPAFDTRLDTLVFNKKASSTFRVKSDRNSSSVWINPKQWAFKKKDAETGSEQEYSFTLKGGDAYAMLITERIEIPLNSLSEIAVTNMRDVAPDGHLVKEEYRIINGNLVKCLQMEGSTQGIEFTYYGYYYTGKDCTTQLVGFTSKSLFKKYQSDIEDLINGFDIVKE
jgi:hypothetical protein